MSKLQGNVAQQHYSELSRDSRGCGHRGKDFWTVHVNAQGEINSKKTKAREERLYLNPQGVGDEAPRFRTVF